MEEAGRLAILAAGDFPIHRVPLQALHEAFSIVCCDSAYRHLQHTPLDTDRCFVVGDGDSLSTATRTALGSRFIQVDEQDYNDLHKAMAWAHSSLPTPHSSPKVSILGATGLREDHTLGNIAYLAEFMDEYPDSDIEMLTDHGRLTALRGSRTYTSFPGQQVSLFSLTPDVPVSAEGLKWPLEGHKLTRWWQGTLNEALADSFTVTGGDLVVFQTYEPKHLAR